MNGNSITFTKLTIHNDVTEFFYGLQMPSQI